MSQEAEIPVQLVDQADQPLGPGYREEIFAKGLLHRIVRVMLTDEDGSILVQKRQMGERLFPGCWDNSAAGHVDYGEEYRQAAMRELQEELGVRGVELHEVAYYRSQSKDGEKILNRFTKLYEAKVPRDIMLKLQESEVEKVAWLSADEVYNLVHAQPSQVTDGLREATEHWPLLAKNR